MRGEKWHLASLDLWFRETEHQDKKRAEWTQRHQGLESKWLAQVGAPEEKALMRNTWTKWSSDAWSKRRGNLTKCGIHKQESREGSARYKQECAEEVGQWSQEAGAGRGQLAHPGGGRQTRSEHLLPVSFGVCLATLTHTCRFSQGQRAWCKAAVMTAYSR